MNKHRKRTKKAVKSFGLGAFGGLDDYRYGSKKPVTLVKISEPSIYAGANRHDIVLRAMDRLRDVRKNAFEKEGPTVAALRSGLCLRGYAWQTCDAEATSIVSEALRLLGGRRPSWSEGQPNYVDLFERCLWCGESLGASEYYSNRKRRFCSPCCADKMLAGESLDRKNDHRAYVDALRIVKTAKRPVQICLHCEGEFQTDQPGQRFCDHSCAAKSRVANRGEGRQMSCRFCGKGYLTNAARKYFCTKACAQSASLVRQGGTLKVLKPHVFDHFLTMPINEIQCLAA